MTAADIARLQDGRVTPEQSLPPYTGTNKQCADYVKDAQKSMKRTAGLFRRHLLAAVAKPGWFEE